MDDLERKLAALGELEIDHGPPQVRRIARRARVRRLLAVTTTVGIVLVTAIAGYAGVRTFGADELEKADRSVFTAAQRATEAAGSALTAFDMTLRTESGVFTNVQEIHGTGEIDFTRNRSHSVHAPSGEFAAEAFEVIHDGTTSFRRDLSTGDPNKWTRLATPAPGGSAFADQSPNDVLGWLSAVSDRIDHLGQEDLDGVTVDHYRFEIDSELFLNQMAESVEDAGMLIDDLEFESEPGEVWIDGEGRVRRLDQKWTITSNAEVQLSVELTSSFRYFDFGVPVDIQIPAPEDVVEEPEPDFETPDESSSPPVAAYIVGAYGTDTPHLGITRREKPPTLCVFAVPEWAERAQVVDEDTETALVTFEEDELIASPEEDEALLGCKQVASGLVDDLLEAPENYVLEIPGAFPSQSVHLKELLAD